MPGTSSLYQDLSGHLSIRLLNLLPGNDADPIQATLHEHDLDHIPLFETVSYVWGNPSITDSIICNGVPLNITQSLHDALCQFRLASESRLLWTDAICINQQDLDERASQVMIMHDIYRFSVRCLVWLGRADEDSAMAFQIVRDIATVICREKGIAAEDVDRDLDENGRDLLLTQRVRFDGLPPPGSPSWTALFRLFGRPWFTRVWVIQELYFAPSALFFCGADTTTFAPLYHATHWILANAPRLDMDLLISMGSVYKDWNSTLTTMRGDKFTDLKPRGVDQLLYDNRELNATDPRDKVYALMNFREFGNERMDVTPDYTRDVWDVFAEVALAVVREMRSWRVLVHVESVPGETPGCEEFPSWVPLWHARGKKRNVANVWYEHYSASGTSIPKFTRLSDKVIRVLGFEVDVIEDVAEISCLTSSPIAFTRLTPWEPDSISDDGPYPTMPDIIAAYAMTLTGGFSEHEGVFGIPVSPEMMNNHCAKFVAWLERLRKVDSQNTNTKCYPPGLYSATLPCLPEELDSVKDYFADEFQPMVNLYTSGPRRLFRTEKGYLGTGFRTPEVGDKVCVLHGGNVPFVLWKRDGCDGYELVGDAYVHGIMGGEVIKMADMGEVKERDFELH